MPDAETWQAHELRTWLRERFESGAAVAESIRWLAAGFTVAAYECPMAPGRALLVPWDHCTPAQQLPYTDGTVTWPMQLRAICRPDDQYAAPLRAVQEACP